MSIHWLEFFVGLLFGGALSGWTMRLWIFPLWRQQMDQRDADEWEQRHGGP